MPITGGFSRSVVNFDAGARTPAASAFTAVGIALAMLCLSPWLGLLPLATLAATIVIATLSLIDLPAFRRVWRYARGEGVAMTATALATLMLGVDLGILVGVGMSLALHLYGTSRPHSAEVGAFRGPSTFATCAATRWRPTPGWPFCASTRASTSPTCAIWKIGHCGGQSHAPPHDLVLACQAINVIDASALESSKRSTGACASAASGCIWPKVKGPVMDRLSRTELLETLNGRVFLSTFDAWCALHGRGAAPLSHPCIATPACPATK